MTLIPIFSEPIDHTEDQKFTGKEDIYYKKNINYQKMYHEFKMKNWIWLWMNLLFPEVKIISLKNLCQFIVKKASNNNNNNNNNKGKKEEKMNIDHDTLEDKCEAYEAIELYIDYLQLIMVLETKDETLSLFHSPVTLIDDILPFLKDILPIFDKIETDPQAISTFGQKIIENPILSTTISNELIVQLLNEYFILNSLSFDKIILFYTEMVY